MLLAQSPSCDLFFQARSFFSDLIDLPQQTAKGGIRTDSWIEDRGDFLERLELPYKLFVPLSYILEALRELRFTPSRFGVLGSVKDFPEMKSAIAAKSGHCLASLLEVFQLSRLLL